jgi:type III pantothenate kinase
MSKKQILAIDIGNTTVSFGVFNQNRLSKRFSAATEMLSKKGPDRIISKLRLTNASQMPIEAAIISSVVPKASKVLIAVLQKTLNIRCYLLGKDLKVPIKNLYAKPRQVGCDRLVNAYACSMLYKTPAIIVDFGTAITFDYIDKNGSYLGGLITPGIKMSLEALASRTALLPKVSLRRPKNLIGKDTAESIRSGLVHGFSAMCEGLIDRIKIKYSKKAIVISTGGYSEEFSHYCRQIETVDKDLTLKGLNLIYKAFIQKK